MFKNINPSPTIFFNRNYLEERHLIKKSESFSREGLDDLKMQRLKDICLYAYRNCEYYTKIFDEAGLDPKTLRYFDQISVLPYLTKEIVQNQLSQLTSKAFSHQQLEYITTGGSTGVPLGFYLERDVTYFKTYAYEWRQYQWGGVSYFNKRAVMRGRVLPDDKNHLIEGNSLYLSVFHLTRETASYYIDLLLGYSPVYIEAYPSSILFLAEWIFSLGLKPKFKHLKSIFVSSETADQSQLQLISNAFGCQVFNKYGNSEQATIIGQCEKGSLHEYEEYSYTEFMDEAGHNVDTGIGQIVSTSFVNRATPFIRYQTDDLAELDNHSCTCGRIHRRIKRILGRSQDYLIGHGGERISVAAINTHSDAFDGILGFQYFQNTPGEAAIRIVTSGNISDLRKEKIIQEASYRSANCINFKVEIVEKLEKTQRGKNQFIMRNC